MTLMRDEWMEDWSGSAVSRRIAAITPFGTAPEGRVLWRDPAALLLYELFSTAVQRGCDHSTLERIFHVSGDTTLQRALLTRLDDDDGCSTTDPLHQTARILAPPLLHQMVAGDNVKAVNLLMRFASEIPVDETGESVLDYTDSHGWTPLMVAAAHWRNRTHSAAVLLRFGASFDRLDPCGLSALDWAIICRRFETADRIALASVPDQTAFIVHRLNALVLMAQESGVDTQRFHDIVRSLCFAAVHQSMSTILIQHDVFNLVVHVAAYCPCDCTKALLAKLCACLLIGQPDTAWPQFMRCDLLENICVQWLLQAVSNPLRTVSLSAVLPILIFYFHLGPIEPAINFFRRQPPNRAQLIMRALDCLDESRLDFPFNSVPQLRTTAFKALKKFRIVRRMSPLSSIPIGDLTCLRMFDCDDVHAVTLDHRPAPCDFYTNPNDPEPPDHRFPRPRCPFPMFSMGDKHVDDEHYSYPNSPSSAPRTALDSFEQFVRSLPVVPFDPFAVDESGGTIIKDCGDLISSFVWNNQTSVVKRMEPLKMPALHEYIESGLREMPIGMRSAKPVVCGRFKGRFVGARSAVISSASVPDFRIYVHDGDHELKPKSVFGCKMRLTTADIDGRESLLIAVREVKRSEVADYCIRRLQDFTRSMLEGSVAHLLGYRRFVLMDDSWLLARDVCDWNLDEFLNDGPLATATEAELLAECRPLVMHMLRALDYLHNMQTITVFHGNLKPSNVLIDSARRLRLVDFGFGKLCTLGYFQWSEYRPTFNKETRQWHPVCWKPPEYYQPNESYDSRSDIHSAGMLCHYMLTKCHPFVDGNSATSKLFRRVCAGQMQLAPWLPVDAVDLLHKMLPAEPSRRSSAVRLQAHPFFWTDKYRAAFLLEVAGRTFSRFDPLAINLLPGVGDWRTEMGVQAVSSTSSPSILSWMRELRSLASKRQIDPIDWVRRFPELLMIVFNRLSR